MSSSRGKKVSFINLDEVSRLLAVIGVSIAITQLPVK